MEKYLGIILIIALTILSKDILQPPTILGESSSPRFAGEAGPSPTDTLPIYQPVTTESAFTQKLAEETETVLKKTTYQDDPEMEAGEEKVVDAGADGKRVRIIKITNTKDGLEYAREIVSTKTTPAKDKKILRGTKIVWKTLSTADGEIRYWKKMRVYATHYDQHCAGCNEWTAIGLRQGKGVVAVDPKVIPLRNNIYIPEYGMAVAGDTGGAIKGNIIDLGFDDAKTAGWYAHFIDIYLL